MQLQTLPGKAVPPREGVTHSRGQNHQPSLLGAARCSSSDSVAFLVTTLCLPSEREGLLGWGPGGLLHASLCSYSHWPWRKAVLALGFQLRNPSGRPPGKVKVFFMVEFSCSFFLLWNLRVVCHAPFPTLQLCREGVSKRRSCLLSVPAGAPSHQRDIIWLFS